MLDAGYRRRQSFGAFAVGWRIDRSAQGDIAFDGVDTDLQRLQTGFGENGRLDLGGDLGVVNRCTGFCALLSQLVADLIDRGADFVAGVIGRLVDFLAGALRRSGLAVSGGKAGNEQQRDAD